MRFLPLTGSVALTLFAAFASSAQAPAGTPSTAAFPSETPSAPPSASPPAAPPSSATPPAAPPAAAPPAAPAAPAAVVVAPAPAAPPAASPAPTVPPPEPTLVPGAIPPPGPGEDVFSTVPHNEPVWPPRLVQAPGLFGGLEGYAGLLTLGASDTREAYAFVGGQLRLRYDFYELGGYFEVTDKSGDSPDSFRAFGGILGVWLPYRGWVDFEIAAAVGARNYRSDDPKYGAGGYDVSSPTAGLRLGVSDRTSSYDAVAARIGGQLVFTYDFNPADEAWQTTTFHESGEIESKTGSTRVGGYTLALALVLGFDVGKPIKPSPSASGTLGSR